MAADPYATLGVPPDAGDAEIRTAYRRLAMLHHPDHNGGSPESAVRFAEVQEAYAHVKLMRRREDAGDGGRADARDDDVEARIAQMERELAAARELREQASRRAERARRLRRAATGRRPAADRPTDEELGYIRTDDSFTKILDDLAAQVSDAQDTRRAAPRSRPRSLAEWIDELGSRLTGEDERGR